VDANTRLLAIKTYSGSIEVNSWRKPHELKGEIALAALDGDLGNESASILETSDIDGSFECRMFAAA